MPLTQKEQEANLVRPLPTPRSRTVILNPYGLLAGAAIPQDLQDDEGLGLGPVFTRNVEILTKILDDVKQKVGIIDRDFVPGVRPEKRRALHDEAEQKIDAESTSRRQYMANAVRRLENELEEPERIKIVGLDPVVQEIRAAEIRRALEVMDPVLRISTLKAAAGHVDTAGLPAPDRETLAAVANAPSLWRQSMKLDQVLKEARSMLSKATDPEAYSKLTHLRTALRLLDGNTATARKALHDLTRVER